MGTLIPFPGYSIKVPAKSEEAKGRVLTRPRSPTSFVHPHDETRHSLTDGQQLVQPALRRPPTRGRSVRRRGYATTANGGGGIRALLAFGSSQAKGVSPMKCGGCGKREKVAKGWRVRGKWWARCPECVAKWKQERLQEERMNEEAFIRARDSA